MYVCMYVLQSGSAFQTKTRATCSKTECPNLPSVLGLTTFLEVVGLVLSIKLLCIRNSAGHGDANSEATQLRLDTVATV